MRARTLATAHAPAGVAVRQSLTDQDEILFAAASLGIEIVFGREGRLGMRTIRITATGESRFHNTVSTVSRVSDNGEGAGPNHPRPGLEQALLIALVASRAVVSLRPSPGDYIYWNAVLRGSKSQGTVRDL